MFGSMRCRVGDAVYKRAASGAASDDDMVNQYVTQL